MSYLFLFVTGLIIYIQYKREENMVSLVSLLTTPYFFIVLFNNLLFVRNGFYKISDPVLLMIMSSLVVFFLGSILAKPRSIPKLAESENNARFDKYRIEAIRNILLIIGIMGIIKVAFLIVSGRFNSANFNDAEGLVNSGIVGHLLLFSYAILPIDFLYWLENKKKISYLIPVLAILSVAFASFIKYNVIGVVITLFIFTCIYKRSLTKKAVIVVVSVAISLFIGNYTLGFFIKSVNVASSFYKNHLWSYMAGSVIYDNHLFPDGINTQISLGYKIMTFLMAFPNMFIKKFNGGAGIFQHVKKPHLPVGVVYGQTANVTDAFGYLFPVKQGVLSVIIYYLIIFLFGFGFSMMYIKAKRKNAYFNTFICNFMTYFVFFSFFGTFYISPGPWEILIYSSTVPFLFLKTSNLRRGRVRIS